MTAESEALLTRVLTIEAVQDAIHAGCIADIARREAARPGGLYTHHGPDAHRDTAERVVTTLLGRAPIVPEGPADQEATAQGGSDHG